MTQYYFDYGAADDTPDGLSISTPKKTLPAALALALAGNILSFKRGSVWPRTGAFGNIGFDFVSVNPASVVTFNDYGTGADPPTIDCFDYDTSATGWSHAGSGRWTKAYTSQVDRIVLGGSISALGIGGLSYKGSTLTDATNQWYWTANVLHIYTGSTTVSPPIHYGGLAYMTAAYTLGVRFRNSSNLLFENMRVIGVNDSGWLFQADGSDVFDIQLDDCETLYSYGGFKIRSGTHNNRQITLNRPIYNNKTDATENEGASARMGGSDGIHISRSYDDIVIYDPTITRARHSGIGVEDSVGYTPGDVTITARSGYGAIDSDVIEFGRAINCVGSQAGQNIKISGIKSTGQSTRSQFSGTCVISGCSWKSLRYSLPAWLGYEVSQVAWFQSWDTSPGNSFMVDVTFQNNLIENPWSAPIEFLVGTATAGSFDANKIKIYNNTIIDEDHYGYLGRKSIQASGTVNSQLIKNNNLITPSAGADQVRWDGVDYTINAKAGFTGNVENIEGYVDRAAGDYHPQALGGLKFAGVAGGASALDLYGIAFNSVPSIAPLEYSDALARLKAYPGVGHPTITGWAEQVGSVINNLLIGKLNNTGTFILVNGGVSTTVSDVRCGPNSVINIMATNAGGAVALDRWSVQTKTNGSFVVTHVSTSTAMCTAGYAILG